MSIGRLLLALLVLLTAQTVATADDAIPATLRIGTSAGYPPLTFKQDGKLNGALEALKRHGTLNRLTGKWIPVQVKVRQ